MYVEEISSLSTELCAIYYDNCTLEHHLCTEALLPGKWLDMSASSHWQRLSFCCPLLLYMTFALLNCLYLNP